VEKRGKNATCSIMLHPEKRRCKGKTDPDSQDSGISRIPRPSSCSSLNPENPGSDKKETKKPEEIALSRLLIMLSKSAYHGMVFRNRNSPLTLLRSCF
jgi:hypothetical protein